VEPPISAARCAPRSVLRTARITCAPARASRRVVPRPTPLVAPVTMIRLPARLPSRLGDHAVVTPARLPITVWPERAPLPPPRSPGIAPTPPTGCRLSPNTAATSATSCNRRWPDLRRVK
jgi:hypothetical protein